MSAIRHYWNTCLPLVKQSLERKLLIEPLTLLLDNISELHRIYTKSKVRCIPFYSIALQIFILYII